jgi:uncharacterized protein involved in exopolysaccharide biosynthesis
VNATPTNGSGPEQVDLLELATILLKRKRLIAGVTLTACAISVAVALLLPPIYMAETKILPPQQSGSGMVNQLLGQLGGASALLGAATGMKNPNELYVGMLESRTVIDRVIDRFGLMKLYDEEYREDARNKLLKNVEVSSDRKSGIISVAVEDRDPKRAADMANAFVEELKVLVSGLAVTEAAQRRLFFEEQLKNAKDGLGKAENEIRGFMEKTGALQIDSQAKAVIEGIATLRAQIAAREVQLKVLQGYATSQNPDLQRVQEEIRGLKFELAKLEGREGKGFDPLMPTGRMPSVGTDYLRKLREVKYYETLFEILAKQYELARIDEARDSSVIQVIDKAVPPERKVKPRRRLIVLAATFLGFAFGVTYVLFAERKRRGIPLSGSQGVDQPIAVKDRDPVR